jgi:DNA-3-methyladenine glycosylase
VLVRKTREGLRSARIVETEAYPLGDPACHAFGGQTLRNRSLFARRGHVYVYRIHRSRCLNVATGRVGRGEGVLIRAVEPMEGLALMESARSRASVGRRVPSGVELTNGPGKLCQALDIELDLDGFDLLAAPSDAPLSILPRRENPAIMATPRIGISVATEALLRFVVRDCPWISR